MKAVVQKQSATQCVIEIEIDRSEIDVVYNEKLNASKKKVQLPGFRAGKVPTKMIEAQFGPSIRAEAMDEIMNKSFREACKENKLEPVSDPSVTDLKDEPGAEFSFKIAFEVDPEITVTGYKDLTARPQIKAVEDAAIDETIDDMRERLAGLKDTGAPSRTGDFLNIEYVSVKIDGEVRDLSAPVAPLELGKSAITPFNSALVGMSAGEVAKVSDTFAEDFFNKEFAGHTVDFEVKVTAVSQKDLPVVDAEFAKRVGDFDDVATLRDAIRKDHEERAKVEAREAAWSQAISELISKNPFEVPQSRVEYFIDRMAEDEAKYYQQGQVPTRDEVAGRYREMAVNTIKKHRLINWIAEAENVKAPQSEVDERIKAIADYYQRPFEEIKENLRRTGRTVQIREEIREQKVLNRLIGEETWA